MPGPPVILELTNISFSQLNVTWMRPDNPNGVIKGYYVTWRMVTNDLNEAVKGTLNGTVINSEKVTFFVINNLGTF